MNNPSDPSFDPEAAYRKKHNGTRWNVFNFLLSLAFLFWAGHYALKLLDNSEWGKDREAKQAAKQKALADQEAADMQPRVIREIDGCKVYAFKSIGHWHFFTRCPISQTTTETNRTVYAGREGKVDQYKRETTTITTTEK